MVFQVSDRVIHPRYGLGQVTSLAVKQFIEGEKRLFYEISFPGSTLWVPLNLSGTGIRKLTGKSEIATCRRLLQAPAKPLSTDPKLRQTELRTHLKLGTLTARCEVVRDLAANSCRKPLSATMATFLKTTQTVLCQEWAAVEGISLSEATREIESLLEKASQVNGKA